MRIRHALPLATTLILAAAGCGDGGEEAPVQEDPGPSVTVDEVREPAAADTSGEEAEQSPAVAEESSEATARTRTLYTVQLGAFVRDDNARSLRQELEDAGLPTWTATVEIEERSFQRIRIGAVPTVAEARSLARRLQERFDADFWIAVVPPEEELPSGLVDATRRLIEGG